MAFADYTDLRVAVVEQIGSPDISDVMDRLVLLAEARFNQRLRTRRQMKTRPMVSINGRAKLPADFLEVTEFLDPNGHEIIGRPVQSSGTGFAVEDGFFLLPDGRYNLRYYTRIPTLTASATASNWLLRDYPGAYLYAVSAEAAKYLRKPDESSAYAAMAEDELRQLERVDFRERYSRARVRVEGPTP